jgi:hypothetical protein
MSSNPSVPQNVYCYKHDTKKITALLKERFPEVNEAAFKVNVQAFPVPAMREAKLIHL